MLRYSDTSSTPPGNGYPYTQQETGYGFKDPSLKRLLNQVRHHRIANTIPIGVNFEAEVEDKSCREILEKYPDFKGCVDADGQSPYRANQLTTGNVFEFLKMAAVWISKGAPFVDQAEADRRAKICLECPKNTNIGQCVPCAAGNLLRSVKGGSTKLDERLHVCAACGCHIPSKIWFPKDVMQREGVQYPLNCWMVE